MLPRGFAYGSRVRQAMPYSVRTRRPRSANKIPTGRRCSMAKPRPWNSRAPAGAALGAASVVVPMLSHLVAAGAALKQSDPLRAIGEAGSCEIDVACLSNTVRQQAANAINAVARVVLTDFGQTYVCSGTLLNDSLSSSTPYFYTANHCFDDDDNDPAASKGNPAAAATSVNTYWFFQSSPAASTPRANVNYTVRHGWRAIARPQRRLRLDAPAPSQQPARRRDIRRVERRRADCNRHRSRRHSSSRGRPEEIQSRQRAGISHVLRRQHIRRNAVVAGGHRAGQQRQWIVYLQHKQELL